MTSEKLMDAIGMMEEAFLADALGEQESGKRVGIFHRRLWRNALAAVVAVALLGCMVFAGTVPEAQKPAWEAYEDADVLLDILFGTQRVIPDEGQVEVQKKMVGKLDDGTVLYEEQRIPVISGASNEPVGKELASLVEPYLIPVEESLVDPTGTITLEVMAYYYEPESECGAIYLRLTDPTGEFCGYVPVDPGIVQTPGEEAETPQGIGDEYLQIFERAWGKSYAHGWPCHLRYVESLSDETAWTFVVYFFCDNYDTVDLDIGFKTDPGVDYRPYRIDIDLEQTPTMETVTLGNAENKNSIHISPVGMRIGEDVVSGGDRIYEAVIHFKDGSSYVVVDQWERPSLITGDETTTYGYAMRANNHFAFANIIDVAEIDYVAVNGKHYFNITW